MQHHWSLLYIAMAILAMNFYAQALEVTVIPTESKVAKTKTVEVILQYKNTGSNVLLINKWLLPQKTLYDPIFEVTRKGKSVQYIGKLIKRATPTVDHVISLGPGKTIKTLVDVSSAYDMVESGSYNIKFNMDIDRVLFSKTGAPQSKTTSAANDDGFMLQSASVTLFIEGRPNPLTERTTETTDNFNNCSSNQSRNISSAFSYAKSYANSAVTYLRHTKPSGALRYVTWFGKYSRVRWNKVKRHFTKTQNALDTETYVFDCSCTDPDTYAYVYPRRPYKVYLCGEFWSAPITGTNSKAGTLVHESSHFTVIGGTQDFAYGHGPCKKLAIRSPRKAVMNADNYEYFAENNPVLK